MRPVSRIPPRPIRSLPEIAPTRTIGYTVAPDVAAVIVEAARQLGAPLKAGAQSQEAFDRALARLLKLAHCELNLRLYESSGRL